MKVIGSIFLFTVLAAGTSCNNGKKTAAGTETAPATSGNEAKPGTTNNVKEYKVTFDGDTAVLGKEKNLLITLKGATAIALQDPDGKEIGTELKITMTLTNKAQIGKGSSDHVDYTDSRLQLDNGTSISAETGTDYLRAEPEATSKEETWTYKLPAGTRSKSVSLFKDDTRVTVGVTMQ